VDTDPPPTAAADLAATTVTATAGHRCLGLNLGRDSHISDTHLSIQNHIYDDV
jgi:hypothetical protein